MSALAILLIFYLIIGIITGQIVYWKVYSQDISGDQRQNIVDLKNGLYCITLFPRVLLGLIFLIFIISDWLELGKIYLFIGRVLKSFGNAIQKLFFLK